MTATATKKTSKAAIPVGKVKVKAKSSSKKVIKRSSDKIATDREKQENSRIDQTLLEKAVHALVKYHNKSIDPKQTLLGSEAVVQVQLGLMKPPQYSHPKPIRILLPHSFRSQDADVCLIVKDESKPHVQEMIQHFPEQMKCIKKVLTLTSLRTKHAQYQQRRALLHQYDVFLADDRILPMLTILGRDFYKAKRQPIPISLTRKEALPFAIQRALTSTHMSWSKGTCVTVVAGKTDLPLHQLVDNVAAVAQQAVQRVPGKWRNCLSIACKTPDSMALPFYNRTPGELLELAGVKLKSEKEVKEVVVKDVESDRKRVEKSPLAQAIKKQKVQETQSVVDKDRSTQDKADAKKEAQVKIQKKSKQMKHPDKIDKIEKEAEPKAKERSLSKKGIQKASLDEASDADKSKIKPNKKTDTVTQTKDKKEKKRTRKSNEPADKVTHVSEETTSQPNIEAASDKKESKSKQRTETIDKVEPEEQKAFIAAKKYKGSKVGYVFKTGEHGLGYYVDVKPVVDTLALEALLRAAGQNRKNGNRKSAGSGQKRRGRR